MRRNAVLICALSCTCFGQWLNFKTPGIPRTPDGKPILTSPAPRTPDGKLDLSGLWGGVTSDRYNNNIAVDLKPEEILPWAAAVHNARLQNFGKDSMGSLCLPQGPASLTGGQDMRIIQSPTIIAITFENLTYRHVFLDGRELEKNPNPTWMGYSVGRWEGDELVVESNGYTPRVWLDFDGNTHTEELRITERFRRPDLGHLEISMTLSDPKAYSRPWTVLIKRELSVDTEMLEYACNENEADRRHMDSNGAEISERKMPDALLERYVGKYEFTDMGKPFEVELSASQGALYWDQDNSGKQRLLPFSDTSFSYSGTYIVFEPGTDAATHFIIRMAEGDVRAERSKAR